MALSSLLSIRQKSAPSCDKGREEEEEFWEAPSQG